jgi:hypothetical protein
MATAKFAHYQAQLPPDKRLGVFFWDVWDPVSFADWLRDQAPDGIVSQGPQPVDVLRQVGPCKIDFCWLVAQINTPEISGPVAQQEELGAQAVTHLSAALLHGDYGPPRTPIELMVQGQWREAIADSAAKPLSASKEPTS